MNRLCGFPPFYEESNQLLFDKIKKAEYDFPSPFWDDVSDSAKELIRSLLQVDPSKRLNAEQILQHSWISGADTPRKQLPTVTAKMKEYNAKRKFKVFFINKTILFQKAAYLVMAAHRFQNILKAR